MANLLDWLFSDSSSGEGQNQRHKKVYRPRRNSVDSDFRALYRFNRENFIFLVNHFLFDEKEKTRGGGLTSAQKMKICLRYIGDPGFQVGVGEDIGVHQTTVCKTFWYVCKRILQKSDDWVHFPSNDAEFNEAKLLWRRKYNFPCAIGAIDCSLFAIKKPPIHGDEYICRKNFPALNAQATCNAHEMFTSCDCTWAGSVHDARIWRNSEVQRALNENSVGALVLADQAYPLTPWVMPIYRNPVTHEQRVYNQLHKKERVIIERMFGQLKKRFPVLDDTIRVSTQRIPQLISACIVLFNVSKFLNDPDFGEDEERQEENYDELQNEGDPNDTIYGRGLARRNHIAAAIAGL